MVLVCITPFAFLPTCVCVYMKWSVSRATYLISVILFMERNNHVSNSLQENQIKETRVCSMHVWESCLNAFSPVGESDNDDNLLTDASSPKLLKKELPYLPTSFMCFCRYCCLNYCFYSVDLCCSHFATLLQTNFVLNIACRVTWVFDISKVRFQGYS